MYSPYPFPWRSKEGGLADGFARAAWSALRNGTLKQFSRLETVDGKPMMRVALADTMRPGCVQCHNSHPQTPRSGWKAGDVRGVLEVRCPLGASIVATESNLQSLYQLAVGVGVTALFLIALIMTQLSRAAERALAASRSLGLARSDLERQHEIFLHKSAESEVARTELLAAKKSLEAHVNDLDDGRIATLNILQDMGKAKEAPEQGNRSKSAFLANMSHEIRRPLNGTLGMLGLVLESELDDEQRNSLRTAQSSGEHLLGILDDLLDSAKVESGKLVLESVAFDPKDLTSMAVLTFSDGARGKGEKLSAQIAETTPNLVRGDPTRVRQVLLNLIGNAVKFTEQGSITVTLNSEPSPSHDGSRILRVEVQDTGVGLPPGARDKIFERFAQADESTTREFGGTGLGLALCRNLVDLMGGNIGVVETPDGSTFWFTVSVEDARAEDQPTAIGTHEFAVELAHKAKLFEGLRVLVIEDTAVNQKVAKAMLRRLGADAQFADNGLLGLEALKNGSFDVVFMDCHMPVMDGYEATRQFRTFEKGTNRTHTPIVALTAHARPEDRAYCLAAGMDDHLAKPFRRDDLVSAVSRQLKATPN